MKLEENQVQELDLRWFLKLARKLKNVLLVRHLQIPIMMWDVAIFSLHIPKMDFKFGETIKVSKVQQDLNLNQTQKQLLNLKR